MDLLILIEFAAGMLLPFIIDDDGDNVDLGPDDER